MLTREELGRRIAEARRCAGMTQEVLAREIGLDRTAVTRIEQGKQGVDSLQLSRIAAAVNRPPGTFFELGAEETEEALLRAAGVRSDDVRRQLEWLESFVRDYEFLRRLASAPGSNAR
jgi:transcriptional regulator with XRE-family HTH domain